MERMAGGRGTVRGSGGMASKLAAAKIASWSGVRAVIAAANRPGVLAGAVEGRPGVGHGRAPARPAAARPQAVDRLRHGHRRARSWSTTAPAGPWSSGVGRCCRPGIVDVQGDFEAERRGRDRRRRREGLRQGPGPAERGRPQGRRRPPHRRPARGHAPRGGPRRRPGGPAVRGRTTGTGRRLAVRAGRGRPAAARRLHHHPGPDRHRGGPRTGRLHRGRRQLQQRRGLRPGGDRGPPAVGREPRRQRRGRGPGRVDELPPRASTCSGWS